MTNGNPRQVIMGLSLDDKLKMFEDDVTFKNVAKSLNKGIYSDSVEIRDQSRNFLGQYATRAGIPIDYENTTQVKQFVDAANSEFSEKASGFFEDNGNGLINEAVNDKIPGMKDKLAKFYTATPGKKTGDKKHDKIVEQHEKVRDLETTAKNLEEGKIGSEDIVKKIIPYIEQDIKDALSPDKDPQNAYLTDKTKNLFTAAVLNSIKYGPAIGSIFNRVRELEKKKLIDSFANDDEKVKYVATNLKALNDTGGKDRDTAIDHFYAVLTSK